MAYASCKGKSSATTLTSATHLSSARLRALGCTSSTKTSANTAKSNTQSNNGQLPWWIWFGGILGAFFVLGNVYLAALLGTGMTVVVLLITGTTGGLIVDHFGLFRSPVKPINGMKVLGIIAMIAGAALIKLL